MKKSIFVFLSLFLGIGLFAQTSVDVKGISVTNYQAAKVENQPKMFTVPVVAEVDVLKGAARSYEFTYSFRIPGQDKAMGIGFEKKVNDYINQQIDEVKSRALFEFTEKTGADIILSPTYSINTVSSSGMDVTLSIKVKGYPAVYKNFRSITAADAELLKINNSIVDNTEVIKLTSTSTENTTKVLTDK